MTPYAEGWLRACLLFLIVYVVQEWLRGIFARQREANDAVHRARNKPPKMYEAPPIWETPPPGSIRWVDPEDYRHLANHFPNGDPITAGLPGDERV